MAEKTNAQEVLKELAENAEDNGLFRSDIHRMVDEAFTGTEEEYLKSLHKDLAKRFEKQRKEKHREIIRSCFKQIGGENMLKPDKVYTCGPCVRAAIWANPREIDGRKFTAYAIQVERRYKDEEGKWQGTNRFRQSDLPKLELVVRKAYEFIALREREPQEEGDREEGENDEDPEA